MRVNLGVPVLPAASASSTTAAIIMLEFAILKGMKMKQRRPIDWLPFIPLSFHS